MEPASMSGGVSSVTSRISMVVAGCSLDGGGAIDVSPLKEAASQKESSLLHTQKTDRDHKIAPLQHIDVQLQPTDKLMQHDAVEGFGYMAD
jgi:hypothetical protein